MSVQSVTNTDELDELHWAIIDAMLEGRERDEPWGFASPQTLSEATGESSQLMNNRLRDLRIAGIVERRSRGHYRINPSEIPERDE